MKLNILAFGIAKEIIGSRNLTLQIDALSVRSLVDVLEERYPALQRLSSYRIAVNQEYADMDHKLNEQDEIAIIPPVSGG